MSIQRRCVVSDDIMTKLEFLLQEGAEIIKEQAAEIERLREELAVRNNQYSKLEIEAANEIQRLRAELAMAQKWRDNFKLAYERLSGKTTRHEDMQKSLNDERVKKYPHEH